MPAQLASLPLIFSLLDTPAFGGAEQYLLAQLMHLARHGYPVVVATNQPQVKTIYQARIAEAHLTNIKVVAAPYRLDIIGDWKGLLKFFWGLPAAVWWASSTLAKLTRDQKVVCFWPGWTDRLVFSPLAKLFGASLIWIEIGPLAPLFGRNLGLPKLLHRAVHRLPDHIITTSDWTTKSMIALGQLPAAKISRLYPGIQTITSAQLARLQKAGQVWVKKHGLSQKTLISWVGRLAQENELELLLQALAQLSPKHHLLVIGDGPDKNTYQQLAQDLGIAQRVIWAGFVDEKTKAQLVSASQVFVFTRAWDLDGFGMTTIEAMNLAVPAITTRFGPQLEIIKPHQTGWNFEPHSVASLTATLRQVLRLPSQQRLAVGQQGRTSVIERFSLSSHLDQLRAVIQSVTQQ